MRETVLDLGATSLTMHNYTYPGKIIILGKRGYIAKRLSDTDWCKNNQVIYLGNDARKEIDKAISETEEWLEEVQKYDWLKL